MFDTVCKFLAETFPQDFAQWLLGEPIDLTELSPSELSLEPIRADSVILLQSSRVILHLEFQTRPDAQIPFRMLDYRVRLYRRFPDRPVEQVVFYLTPSPSPLVQQTAFELPHTRHEFRVTWLWEQPVAAFLDAPGLLPFAILCQNETDDPVARLRQVAQFIDILPSRTAQAHIAASSAILAGLILEKSIIQQVLRRDLMRESVMYQSILREGWEEGHNQGIEQGLEQGVLVGKLAAVPVLLGAGLSLDEAAERLDVDLRLARRSALPWLLRQGRSLAEIAAEWRLQEPTLESIALVELVRAQWADGEILARVPGAAERLAAVRSAPLPPLFKAQSSYL